MSENKFEHWAVVELMGHSQCAGRCTEQSVAGTNMLRVDIPDPNDAEKFITRYYGGSAIYAVHIVDEAIARAAANARVTRPAYEYQAADMILKLNPPAHNAEPTSSPSSGRGYCDDEDDDN